MSGQLLAYTGLRNTADLLLVQRTHQSCQELNKTKRLIKYKLAVYLWHSALQSRFPTASQHKDCVIFVKERTEINFELTRFRNVFSLALNGEIINTQ
jgi:hypothetical protein